MGGNNMALSPRGMLAFGEAMRLGGAPVVPAAWLETSWRPRTRSPFSGHRYGYGWFLARFGGPRTRLRPRLRRADDLRHARPRRSPSPITSDPTQPARSEGHAGDLHRLVGEILVPAARAGSL